MIADISHPDCDVISIFKGFKHYFAVERDAQRKALACKNVFYSQDLAEYISQDPNPCVYVNHERNAYDIIQVWKRLGIVHEIYNFRYGHYTLKGFSHKPMLVWSFRYKWRKYLKKRGIL